MNNEKYEEITPAEAVYLLLKEYIKDVNIFLSYMPEGTEETITVYDRGHNGNYFIGPNEPLIQIMVKDTDYNRGYNTARDINKILNSVNNYEVYNIKLKAIHPTSGILPLGWYDEGYHKFSMNYRSYVVDSY